MGLKVVHHNDFRRRYLALDHENPELFARGFVRWHNHARAQVEFDEDEVAALHAEELLKEKPFTARMIEESIAQSLAAFSGTRLTDAAKKQMVAVAVEDLKRHGNVESWSVEAMDTDTARILANMRAVNGAGFQFNLKLKLNG